MGWVAGIFWGTIRKWGVHILLNPTSAPLLLLLLLFTPLHFSGTCDPFKAIALL